MNHMYEINRTMFVSSVVVTDEWSLRSSKWGWTRGLTLKEMVKKSLKAANAYA